MKIEVVPATIDHVLGVIDILREVEAKAFKNKEAIKLIERAFDESRSVYAGLIDDRIVGVWGIKAGTLLSRSAMIWLLTTKLIEEHPLVFVRHSQIELKKLEEEFSIVWGYVWANYSLSVKWLHWLGFTFYSTDTPGVHYFEKRSA
jgi:hypothetical protein